MGLIDSPAGINRMLRRTPGSIAVKFGGIEGWGHDAHLPSLDGIDGVVVSEPAVTVANEFFPGLGVCTTTGRSQGVGSDIQVGDFVWRVRGLEPTGVTGEVIVMLSNRTANG